MDPVLESADRVPAGSDRRRVGLVLMGGGARGAYEAGALSVLGPALERRGERPTLFVGSSVGALNAVAMAAMRHRPAGEAAERGLARWREAVQDNVLTPIVRVRLPRLLARYAARLVAPGRVPVAGLLDPGPLSHSLRRWIDWEDLHRNVGSGLVDAVAVMATEVVAGRTVAFVHSGRARARRSRAIGYVSTELGIEHLLASAAMPMLFPPVQVGEAWYVDGSTRLRNPLKPALDLGAERLVIVGTNPLEARRQRPPASPTFAAGALAVLNGLLEDPVHDDLRRLAAVNRHFAAGLPGTEAATRYRRARGKPPYRRVPYIHVAPERHGEIAGVAAEVLRASHRGWRALRSPDLPFLRRALGGGGPLQSELLSYFLYDRGFIARLAEMGRRDARRALEAAGGGDPWRTEPPAALVA